MIPLKQSTEFTQRIGPFLDATDGVTEETALAGNGTELSKNGGAFAAGPTLGTHDAEGYYPVTLTTTHTNTVGPMRLKSHDPATHLPVWEDFYVFEEAIYDALFGSGAGGFDSSGRVAIGKWLGTAVTLSAGSRPNVDVNGHTPQTGDNYARLGAPAGASVSADVAAVKADANTLLTRLSAARAGYLDNLNVGGAVASQADINALNQSASRRVILTTVGQYERPEAGSVTYTVEARTYDGDGAAVNADSTPTLTATGGTSGDLSANLSVASNPATGVYRWTYTVDSVDTLEEVRYDLSATISASAFPMSVYTQVADFVAATFTTADRSLLQNASDNTDTITGADGATLATAQALYAPAKAGDQMDLINAPNATAVTAIQSGLATSTNQTTILNRIGAWTGTGVNTILGAFKAALSKTATTPADIGGTFDPADDSTEAIRDRGDAAWVSGGGGGGATNVTIESTNITVE